MEERIQLIASLKVNGTSFHGELRQLEDGSRILKVNRKKKGMEFPPRTVKWENRESIKNFPRDMQAFIRELGI